MTAGMAHHLVSRAIDVTQQHYNGNDAEQTLYKFHWAAVLIFATVALYLAVISMISYTYGDVVATLTIIETPTATAFKTEYSDSDEIDAPLISQDEKSEKAKVIESDLFLVKQKPITSKMRTTIKHLRAQAGPLARFRGLHVSIIYHILHGGVVGFFSSHVISHPVARPFIAVFASIALCRLQMTWTHIVISNRSSKSWFRRIPSRTAVRNILIPTAVFAIAEQATIYVPGALFLLAAQAFNEEARENVARAQNIALLQMFLIGLIGIGIFVLVVIPADVTLKRVQASMLPEEDEAIVLFDRTFGGKVKPEILGGSGAVSMLDAWKSFDGSARIRLMKLYLKVFLISVFTTIMFIMVLVGELRLIMGDKFNGLAGKAHEGLQQVRAGSPMF
ncbi:hypothetical protein HO133_010880 [Letharia lupina]|uniref:Uncharacterized protein n=1 Tax=Letharia lupina TaxID=560253 RepID=A0A8H6CIW9_9LECA|nr:uncharacterized protein HO133_010880 [Letharia lupina]KAF6224303.1 hypothetical protein HO133_010880 [Letharia lupina]